MPTSRTVAGHASPSIARTGRPVAMLVPQSPRANRPSQVAYCAGERPVEAERVALGRDLLRAWRRGRRGGARGRRARGGAGRTSASRTPRTTARPLSARRSAAGAWRAISVPARRARHARPVARYLSPCLVALRPAARRSSPSPAASRRAARRGATVLFASGADLQSINPLLTLHPLARQVQRYVLLTTLARYDSALVPRPYLARAGSWSPTGGRSRLHLAAGVRWHDGVPTTARDVRWTLDAARDPASAIPAPAELAGARARRRAGRLDAWCSASRRRQPRFPDVLTDLAIAAGASARHRAARPAAPGRVERARRSATAPSASWPTSPTAAGSSPPTPTFPPRWAGRPGSSASSSSWWTSPPPSSRRSPRASSTSPASSRPTPSSSRRDPDARRADLSAALHLRHRLQHPPAAVRRARRAPAARRGDRPAGDRGRLPLRLRHARHAARCRPDVPGYVPVSARRRRAAAVAVRRSAFELLTVGSGEAPLEQMVQARLRARRHRRHASASSSCPRFSARVYGPAHDFDAAVLGMPGDAGLGYLGPLAALAGLDGAGRSGRGAAAVRRLGAGGVSLSRARTAGHEPPGARGDDGSPGRAADGARLVGGAVSGAFRAAGAGPARLRRRLDRRAAVLRPRGRRGGLRRDRAPRPRRGAAGRRRTSARRRGPGRDARAARRRRARRATGPLALLQAGLRLLPVGACALTTRSDAPPGSGLGSSGALDVALVARAGGRARRDAATAREVAELACRLERVEAGIPGGRQDQFTAAYGGFLRLALPRPRRRRSSRSRSTRRCSPSSSGA